MTYQETIAFLYQATPAFERNGASAYKPGLHTTEVLDAHYGHPHRSFRSIHIAGTNGKGSVSHSIASILQEEGMKVGLYTSPHLVDFRERIRVNGCPISEQRVIDFVADYLRWSQEQTEELHPSFFELTTALALAYFEEQGVDIAVIEVGLGGRLDSTNIISPILSVITNISFDHTQFLGTTLPEIASEKAGIIKRGVPVVIGEANELTRPVFEQKANEVNAPIVFADEEEWPSTLPDFELKGSYQLKNLRTILCAMQTLSGMAGVSMSPQSVENGLFNVVRNTHLMGRWQQVRQKPLVICDTGHNAAAWEYLAPQIAHQPCHQLRIVFGMVDDKDIRAVLNMLPATATYYFTQADSHRAIPATEIERMARETGLKGHSYDSVAKAYRAALSESGAEDFLFVGGSSYIVADFLTTLV